MISNSSFDILGLITYYSYRCFIFYYMSMFPVNTGSCSNVRRRIAVSFLRFACCIVEGGVGGEQFLRPFPSENLTLLCFTLSCN